MHHVIPVCHYAPSYLPGYSQYCVIIQFVEVDSSQYTKVSLSVEAQVVKANLTMIGFVHIGRWGNIAFRNFRVSCNV